MELTTDPSRHLFAALEPEERLHADAGMVRNANGITELHVQLGPVTFRLLDQAALEALHMAYLAAKALAEGVWPECTTCGQADALVELIDGRQQHLACAYTDREAYPYDGDPRTSRATRAEHLRLVARPL